MPRAKISIIDKERLIAAFERNEDYQELAEQIGIKRTTAWSIVRRFQVNGVVARQRGGSFNVKCDVEMTQCVTRIVEENPTFTLNQINEALRVELPQKPHVCINSVANMLNGQLITMKKMEDAPAERNSPPTKESRQEFAEWMLQHGINQELIFIDEAGFNLWLKRTRGRARRGHRAVRVVGGQRGPNITSVFAVSNIRGLILHEIFPRAMTGDRFVQFLSRVSTSSGHGRITFVFDNAPVHRRAGDSAIAETHTLRWLPPYSPFLNIVEQAFSCWKAGLKRQLAEVQYQQLGQRNEERLATLYQLAEQSTAEVTPEKSQAWFRHLQSYLPRCIRKDDIFM